jgi:hypothetical protein
VSEWAAAPTYPCKTEAQQCTAGLPIHHTHLPGGQSLRSRWTKLSTTEELKAAGNRVVIKTDSAGKVLIQGFQGDVYAVSNKCPHLGLPMQVSSVKVVTES